MKKSKAALVILGFAAASACAFPAAAQVYLGASAGSAKAKEICAYATTHCDDKDFSWGGFAGYQINRNFGVEIGGRNLGKIEQGDPGSSSELKTSVAHLLVVGSWANERFSLFGMAGPYRAKSKLSSEQGMAASSNNAGWTVGVGMRYDFTSHLGARLEFQRYNNVGGATVGGKSDFDVVGVSGLFSF